MPDFDEGSYRVLMGGMTMDDELKDRIRREASRASRAERVVRRAPSRRTFVKLAAAVAGVAVVSVAAAGALPTLSGMLGGASGGLGAQGGDGADGAGSKAGTAAPDAPANSFGLLAYADEGAVEAGRVKALSLDFFTVGSMSGGRSSAGDACTIGAEYLFNFACTGTNVATVTYTLGDGSFALDGPTPPGDEYVGFYEETQLFDGDKRLGATVNGYGSFTLDYGEQGVALGNRAVDDPLTRRTIMVGCVASDETAALYDQIQPVNGVYPENFDALDHELRARSFYESALALGRTPLTLTAVFEDGSQRTKTYRIGPVDDFLDRALAADRSASDLTAFFEMLPSLHAITEEA